MGNIPKKDWEDKNTSTMHGHKDWTLAIPIETTIQSVEVASIRILDKKEWLSQMENEVALDFIIKSLLTKDSSDEHIDTVKASVQYMLEQYWTLYAKSLMQYKWNFLFYQALWGGVWDERYLMYKNNAEALWFIISEEEVVQAIIKYWFIVTEEEKTELTKKYREDIQNIRIKK